MKKWIFLFIFLQAPAAANDFIFLGGFDKNVKISGYTSGIISTGLQIKLTSGGITQNLSLDKNGRFVFDSDIPVGSNWVVVMKSLPFTPKQQSCVIRSNSGVMPANGVNNIELICNDQEWVWGKMNWNQAAFK